MGVAKGIQTANEPSASVEFREETLHLKLRWDVEQFRAALIKTFGAKAIEQWGAPVRPVIDARVSAVLIDRQIAIIAVPGEPFVDFKKAGVPVVRFPQHCSLDTPTDITDTFRR